MADPTTSYWRPIQNFVWDGVSKWVPQEGASGGDGAITDGVSPTIKATVKDYANSNPLTVAIVDTNGDPASIGGGTQYTEDAVAAANPVGNTLILVREDARAGSLTTTDGDNVAARGNNKGELYVKHTDSVAITAASALDVQTEEQLDYDSGAGTVAVSLVGLALPGAGGPVAGGTTTNPVQVADAGGSLTIDNAALAVVGGGVEATALRVTVASDSTGVLSIDDNGGSLTVDGTVSVTGVATAANQSTQITAEQATQASVELIDDTVATLGTTTYLEATTKGLVVGAIRRDADTTLVDLTNEVSPLQVDANGRLKVEAFSGETLPVSLTSTTITGTVAVTQSGTWDEVGINDSGNSITVDNAALSVVGGGLEATALRVTLASDSTGVVSVDDNGSALTVDNGGTFAVQATVAAAATNIAKAEDAPSADADVGVPALAVRKATPANTSGLDGDYEFLQMSAGRLWASATIDTALPAGTNAIGKLSANSGVDIGDVDITSIAAGDNNIGNVDIVTMPNVTLAAGTNTNEIVGDVAHDAPVAGNPVVVGGVASAAAPANVSLDQDAVRSWHLLNGAQATVITAAGALIGGDATNGLDVDVTRLPALVAGTANIGDVDVLTVPAPLSTTGGGTEATALRVTIANDSTGLVSIDDNGGSLTVDGTVAATQSGTWTVQPGNTPNTTPWLVGHGKTLKSKTGSASATFTLVAAVASNKIKVYSLSLITASTTAVTITFKDGAAGTALATYPLQAITGTNFGISENVAVPSTLFETAANTLLEMSFSAAQTVTYNLRYFDNDTT